VSQPRANPGTGLATGAYADTWQHQGHRPAQRLTTVKLAGIKTGRLINCNVTKLKNGIKRYVL